MLSLSSNLSDANPPWKSLLIGHNVMLKLFVFVWRRSSGNLFRHVICAARSDLPQILTVSDDAAAGEAGLSLGSAQPQAASVPPVSSCQPRAQGTGRPRLIQADAKFMPISVPLDAKNITITHRHDSILKIFNFLKLNNIHSVRCLSAPASVKSKFHVISRLVRFS